MNACLPQIQTTTTRGKRIKSISFELEKKNSDEDVSKTDCSRNHGNATTSRRTTILSVLGDDFSAGDYNDIEKEKNNELLSGGIEYSLLHDHTTHRSQPLDSVLMKNKETCENHCKTEYRRLLRQKDDEIERLQEVLRKMSFDRQKAVSSHATSRLRINELKNRLSGEHRKTEYNTTMERLRSKQKICSETEQLRHQRDEYRAQLTQHEQLVWQLRKQVDQLGYVCQERHKVIQELNRKMSVKDKNLQELRKRMEQAQLIQICTSNPGEGRKNSVTSETRHVAWETSKRLTTVNEIPSIKKS